MKFIQNHVYSILVRKKQKKWGFIVYAQDLNRTLDSVQNTRL